jgi:hypothetical protein
VNQHRIILSSPRYATRTVTARATAVDARETAARLLIDAPDAAEARASLYRRGRNGFDLVCFLRVVDGVAAEVSA